MTTQPLHVVINQRDFLKVVASVFLDRHRVATARVRERATTESHEMILDRFEVQDNTPSGLDRAPMVNWCVLMAGDQHTSTEAMLERFQPKRSQHLICITIDPADRSRYRVLLWHDGNWTIPSNISMVGSRMLRLLDSDSMGPYDLDDYIDRLANESLRASRTQPALPTGVYDRVRRQRGALIGAGGGGSTMAPAFTSIGLQDLLIIDGDTLGIENLDRMPMIPAKGITENKAVLIARPLARNNPDLVVRSIPFAIEAPQARERLRSMRPDLLVSFVDSNVARLTVSLLARELESIHIDCGSAIRFENGERILSGDIRLFEPGLGRGCVACVPAMPDLEDVLTNISRPEGAMLRGPHVPWDAQRAGSLYHLNCIVSSLATELWISYLAGRIQTSTWIRLRWRLGHPPQIEQASVSSPEENKIRCRFCWQ